LAYNTSIEKMERRWESVTEVIRFRGEKTEFSQDHKEVKV
jgi:hypothetical protein